MLLCLTAKTEIKDLVIDYIEVRTKSGETIFLNWEWSDTGWSEGILQANYRGVCFGENSADGRLNELEGMKVEEVGMYSEEFGEGQYPLNIESMFFEEDDGNCLQFDNIYPYEPSKEKSKTVSEKMYFNFLASSWR